jgi:inhibitor of cysteine peptidase
MVFSARSSSGHTVEMTDGRSDARPVSLGENDSGDAIRLAAGQRLTIQLPANATTGFSWVVAESGGLTQIGEPAYAAPSTSGAVGAGGIATFTFEAGTPGTERVRLEYRRPWEKNVPAGRTWGVTVMVE